MSELSLEQKRRIEVNKEEARCKRARRGMVDDAISRAGRTGTLTGDDLALFVVRAPFEVDGQRGTGGKNRSECTCDSWVTKKTGRCRWDRDPLVSVCYSGAVLDDNMFTKLMEALLGYHARRANPESAEAIDSRFGTSTIDQRAAFRGMMELIRSLPDDLETEMFVDKGVRQLGVHSPGQDLLNSYFPCRKDVEKRGFSAQSRYVQKATAMDGKSLAKNVLRCLEYYGSISNDSFFDEFLFAEGLWISGFQPLTAAALIKRSLRLRNVNSEAIFLDLCGGWWGRGLGAVISGRVGRIITVDPSTGATEGARALWSDVQRWMSEDFADFKAPLVEILQMCAEDVDPELMPPVDLILTSPPYFDLEKYCREPTQSVVKFPSYEQWRVAFLGKLLSTAFAVLKPGGHCIINIANTPSGKFPHNQLEEDCHELAGLAGFVDLDECLRLLPSEAAAPHQRLLPYEKPLRQSSSTTKPLGERIFFFRKPG